MIEKGGKRAIRPFKRKKVAQHLREVLNTLPEHPEYKALSEEALLETINKEVQNYREQKSGHKLQD